MSAAWMKSLTTVSTPLNGTPAVDFLGYDAFNKRVRILSPLHLLLALVMTIELLSFKTFGKYVLGWDHWYEAHSG